MNERRMNYNKINERGKRYVAIATKPKILRVSTKKKKNIKRMKKKIFRIIEQQ